MKQSSKKISTGTAALYCRLSRDDNMDSESNSIQNQELLCRGWFLPPNTYDCGSFVVTEMVPTERAVMFRFTFPENDSYLRFI